MDKSAASNLSIVLGIEPALVKIFILKKGFDFDGMSAHF